MNLSKILLVVMLCYYFTFCFAQQQQVDSLLSEYHKCTVDSTKIDLSLHIATSIISTDPRKSIYYGKLSLKLAQDINDNQREVLAYETIGRGYQYLGDIRNSINNFNEAKILINKLNDKAGLAYLNINIAFLFAYMENNNLAIEYYQKAIEYFSISTDFKGECRCYINISDALYNSNRIDEALVYLQKAKKLSQKHNDYRNLFINTNFAEAYLKKNEYKLAKEYASLGIEEATKQNNTYIISSNYLVFAKISLAKNELKSAEKFARKGFYFAKQASLNKILIESISILYQILDKEKRVHKSFSLLHTKHVYQNVII